MTTLRTKKNVGGIQENGKKCKRQITKAGNVKSKTRKCHRNLSRNLEKPLASTEQSNISWIKSRYIEHVS